MPNEPRSFGFLLFDGFSHLVLANAVEPLRAANGISGRRIYSWSLLNLDRSPVTSSSDITVTPGDALDDAGPLDTLFVVSGYGMRRQVTSAMIGALQRSRHRVRYLGGLDTGSWLLAAAGLLDGLSATIHWQERAAFAEEFPTVRLRDQRHVIEARRITAGGASDVMDLMLQLIREDCGGALALHVLRLFSFDMSPQSLIRREAGPLPFAARSARVTRAVEAMMGSLEEPKGLAEIAGAAGCSLRTLNRKFLEEFDMSPGRYYQQLRLQLARSLVEETNLGLAAIAARSGFAGAPSLSRAFRAHFDIGIRDLRAERRSPLRPDKGALH